MLRSVLPPFYQQPAYRFRLQVLSYRIDAAGATDPPFDVDEAIEPVAMAVPPSSAILPTPFSQLPP